MNSLYLYTIIGLHLIQKMVAPLTTFNALSTTKKEN